MPLRKVSIAVSEAGHAEAVAASLGGAEPAPPVAVTAFEQAGGGYLVEAYFLSEVVLESVVRCLAPHAGRIGAPVLQDIPDVNWVAVSQAALPPVAAGRFVVHGSHDRSRLAMRRLAIEIEAGEAFGTGYNATTALCLSALDSLARRRAFRRALDLGCGTGVLAIAAARIFPGAAVTAIDNDPVAVAIARDNARLNRVSRRIEVAEGSALEPTFLRCAVGADLVLANILPGPLIALAPALARLLAPNGVVVLSGLLRDQVREVAAVYRAAGFHLLARRQDGVWGALTVVRR